MLTTSRRHSPRRFGAGVQNSRYFLVSGASGAPRRRKEITRVLFSGGYKDVAVACLRQAKTSGCPALPHRVSPSRFSTVDKGMARVGFGEGVHFASFGECKKCRPPLFQPDFCDRREQLGRHGAMRPSESLLERKNEPEHIQV